MLKQKLIKILIPVAVLIASCFGELSAGASERLRETEARPASWAQYAQADPASPQSVNGAEEQTTGPVIRHGRRPSVMPHRPQPPAVEEPANQASTPLQPTPLPGQVQSGTSSSSKPPAPSGTMTGPAAQGVAAVQPRLQPARAAMAGGQVTLNFDDADIYTLIQTIFGDVLRVNYIIDPRIKGRVTFRSIAPVPRDNVLPLMEVVMRLNGIGIVEDSGLFRIIPIADISKEPAPVSIGRDPDKITSQGKSILQVIPILNISSSEAVRMMTPFLSQNALVVDVPKGNQIIIVDTDANVKRLLRLLEVFDNEGAKQKKPKIFVYHCQNGKAKDVATTLQQVFLTGKTSSAASPSSAPVKSSSPSPAPQPPAPSSQPPSGVAPGGGDQLVNEITRIFSDDILNAIIVMATPEDYELIKETLVKIDIVQRQVVIEGLIAEVSLQDNLSLGIAGLLKASIGNFQMNLGLNASDLNFDATKPTGSGFSMVGIDSSGGVRAYVTALATESKAKVLASPHILVSDNKEAKIQIGQQVPITVSETYGSTTVAPQRIVQYKDIGIILKVKPRVNEGGLVAMEVGQEVSTYQTIPLGNVGETQIVINKTEANTSLVVQDGQSIIIGGLIREDTTKTKSGIPFLNKIPVLGWLFGNTSDEKQRTELIILLTPQVMRTQTEANKVTSGYIEGMIENSQGRIQKKDLMKGGAK